MSQIISKNNVLHPQSLIDIKTLFFYNWLSWLFLCPSGPHNAVWRVVLFCPKHTQPGRQNVAVATDLWIHWAAAMLPPVAADAVPINNVFTLT
jgi:hypothetical protein